MLNSIQLAKARPAVEGLVASCKTNGQACRMLCEGTTATACVLYALPRY